MLVSKDLTFTYDNSKVFHFPNITLEKGEHLLVLGESGIGKTTLIQLLAGLLTAHSGELLINGTDITTLNSSQLDRFRGKHVGMVFQKPYFVRNISVLENLLLSLYLSKNKQDEKKALHLLEQIGLADKKNYQPNQLSQGEQQRMSIALAVLKNPDLILADEPTSSLDDTNCYKIAQLLEEQAQSTNAQLIIITHDSRLKTHFNNSITL
jgi:putative ABC transport system ATP-binding protein